MFLVHEAVRFSATLHRYEEAGIDDLFYEEDYALDDDDQGVGEHIDSAA